MTGPYLPSVYDRDEISAFDKEGNPVPCIGCGVSMVYVAAMANSGLRRADGSTHECLCPTPEHRVDDPEWYSLALSRINRAAVALAEHTTPHALACTCSACEALRVLRGELP